MNDDLSRIERWALDNGLKLNTAKTQAIVIYKNSRALNIIDIPKLVLSNNPVPFSQTVKNLGLHINNTLTWDEHISMLSRKVFICLRSLWKVTGFADISLKKKLFCSYILPHFLYCDIVFFGMSKTCEYKLRMCFNACIRYVFGLRKFDHISHLSTRLLNCDIFTYYKFRACYFLKNLMTKKCPTYLYEKLGFSHAFHDNLRLIPPKNSCISLNTSIFVRGVGIWNSLKKEAQTTRSRAVFFNEFVMFANRSDILSF